MVSEDAIGGARSAPLARANAMHEVDVLLQPSVRIAPPGNAIRRRPKNRHFETVGGSAAAVHLIDVAWELVHGAVSGGSGVGGGIAIGGTAPTAGAPAHEVPVAHVHVPLKPVLGAEAEPVFRVEPCETPPSIHTPVPVPWSSAAPSPIHPCSDIAYQT